MLGPTAILNHACCWSEVNLVNRGAEGKWLGFYGEAPGYEQLKRQAAGKLFFNVDDKSYSPDVRRFLAERFPDRCQYELPDSELGAKNEAPRQVRSFPRPVLPSRNDIPAFLNLRGLKGEGVEVGVFRGDYSAKLLAGWQGARLHCVDPWRHATDAPEYIDKSNLSQERHDANYDKAITQLSGFGERCRIHRTTSRDAAATFQDRSLDFVYLDARHYRQAVEEDIGLWAPKVRPGGILAGHDYLDGILPSGHFEVKSVVDQWAAARGLHVMCTGESVWRSWLIEIS
jgi:hypothetical protein